MLSIRHFLAPLPLSNRLEAEHKHLAREILTLERVMAANATYLDRLRRELRAVEAAQSHLGTAGAPA